MNPYLPVSKTYKKIPCPQLRFTIAGRWWRIFAGVTFKTKRFRMNQKFYGHRLWVVRLWGQRVIGVQTRKSHR